MTSLEPKPSSAEKTKKSPARKELELLESTGRYVFHGTPDELTELEPRQARTGDPITKKSWTMKYLQYLLLN